MAKIKTVTNDPATPGTHSRLNELPGAGRAEYRVLTAECFLLTGGGLCYPGLKDPSPEVHSA